MKLGLLFPGQGSQSVGMGKDIYENFAEAKAVIDKANDVLGFDLKNIMFNGPDETLKQTKYTQPAIFAASMALYKVFVSNYKADTCICAGHSLGEYSAMCAAGVFDIETGLKLVKARGEFIQKASESKPGTMAAIIGLERDVVADICKKVSVDGVCEAVNFNSPGQIVIAGTVSAVNKAVALANEAKAMKTVVLNVSGAFHSSLMSEAAQLMSQELIKHTFHDPAYAIVTNCDSEINQKCDKLKEKLTKQINHPVLWEDSIKVMISNGVDTFIEFGAGKVLSGLLRRIDKSKKSLIIENKLTLENTIKALNA